MQTKKALISVDMMMIIVWLVINTLLDINVNDEKLLKAHLNILEWQEISYKLFIFSWWLDHDEQTPGKMIISCLLCSRETENQNRCSAAAIFCRHVFNLRFILLN